MGKNNHNFKDPQEGGPETREFDGGKEELEKKAGPEKSVPEGRKDSTDKLESFKHLADQARLEYARKHYEVNNAFSKLRGIFGRHLKTDPKEIGETDTAYERYKKSLNDLKDQALSQITDDASLTPEKRKEAIGDLIKFFSLDEKMELYNAHSQVKADIFEEKFGKFPGWFAKKGSAFVGWYRKQDWKWKMAGGIALTVTGLGIVNRVVSGAVTGVGVAGMVEARHRKKEKEKAEEKKERILEGLEHIKDPEEKMKFISDWMESEIDGLDKDLEKEKRQALYRKAAGVTAGILVGSGAVAHVAREALDKLGVTGVLSQLSHGTDPSHTVQEIPGHPDVSQVPGDHMAPELPHDINLDVPKGSSFEGELIKHLEGTGVDHKEAGKMAHRMYLEYAGNHPDPSTHDYSLIHPGARIELSLDGQHITGFEESPGSDLNVPETAGLPTGSQAVSEAGAGIEKGIGQAERWIGSQDSLALEELEASKKAALYEKSFDVLESIAVASGGAYVLHRLGLTKFIEKNIRKLGKRKEQSSETPKEKRAAGKKGKEAERPESKKEEKEKTKTGAKKEKKKSEDKERIDKRYEGPAIWKNKENDSPVEVVGYAGRYDNREFAYVKGSKTGVPLDELYPDRRSRRAPEEKEGKHPETDNLSFFTRRFDDLYERQEKIEKMRKEYPGLEKEKIPEEKEEELRKIYREIRRSENNIKLSKRAKKDAVEGINKTEKTIEDLERAIKKEKEGLEKKYISRDRLQRELGNYGELFYLKEQSKLDLSEMLRFMLKLVEKKEGAMDLKGDALGKFLSRNPKKGIGRIYHHYSKMLGKDVTKPLPGEDIGYWSVRFLKEVFKSGGILYNKAKKDKPK